MSAQEPGSRPPDSVADWARSPETLRDPQSPAWAECRRFVRALLAGARFRISGDDLEDVTQEVLVALWRSIGTTTPDDLEAWVARVAQRRAYDHYRRNRRAQARHVASDAPLETIVGAEGAIEDHVRAMVVESLPAIARTYFAQHDPTCLDAMRHFFADEDYRDLARELDVKVNTLIKRWSRCHASLVAHLRTLRLDELAGDREER